MTRVAIYARFSDEGQNPRSCEDQIALCREHALRRGWQVVATYQDDAISGFAMANRPGILNAVAAATRREFDVLLAEDEDRIARNMGHLSSVKDDVEFAGGWLATLQHDRVELMHVAFKGSGAQQYLIDLGHKTARGVRANAERGLWTGARKYGYRSQVGGATTIEPDEAALIVRAFELFADRQMSGREIADTFNRERLAGPTGGFWNASTLLGSAERGNGILRSEIYAGVKVWNRDEVRKDPRTGKRSHRYRPPAEWKRTPVEHLRIVEADLWERAQARLAENAGHGLHTLGNARKPGVFSGLLKCGRCGSSFTSYGRGRLVCAGHREKGPSVCGFAKIVDRATVERRALEGLRERLLSPAAVKAYVRAYHAAWARLEAAKRDRRRPLERRLGELTRGIERAVDAIVDGTASAAVKARLAAMEAERSQVEAELAAAGDATAPLAVHPHAADGYAAQVGRLQDVLAEIAADPQLAAANRRLIDAVRGLVEKIEIRPDPAALGGVALRLHGNLALLLAPRAGEQPPNIAGGPLVAGGGYRRAPSASPPIVFDWPLHAQAA